MKKLILLFVVCLSLLCSCQKNKNNDVNNYIQQRVVNATSYKSNCTMNIIEADKSVKFEIEVSYLTGDYYKAIFVNSSNNTKQIIIKNADGVYALTPSLGKEFRFESSWPTNSSHIYMPSSVCNDILNDTSKTVSEKDGNYIYKSTISHKTHNNYKYQLVYINKKSMTLTKVEYYDESDTLKLEALYSQIVFNINLTKDDFNVDKVMNDAISIIGEGSVASITGSLNVGYVVEGATLSNENDYVFVYKGDVSYSIICKDIVQDDSLFVSRLYNDVEMSNNGLVFFNENSATVLYQNKEIQIISSTLDDINMINIINSISFV